MRFLLPLAGIILFAAPAFGQVPFFFGGATIATPQISYATSGAELNVEQAVVSSDRKYVTMDLSPQINAAQGFQSFTFQTASGFVGSAPATSNSAVPNSATGSAAARNARPTPPVVTFFDKPGMTKIASLPRRP